MVGSDLGSDDLDRRNLAKETGFGEKKKSCGERGRGYFEEEEEASLLINPNPQNAAVLTTLKRIL